MAASVKPFIYVALLLLGICAAAPAFADSVANIAAKSNKTAMTLLGATSQPVGHYDFCQRYPKNCLAYTGNTEPLKITQKTLRHILQVNLTVNKKVRAATDKDIYGKEEYWEYPDKSGWRGDCEDYALLKQRELEKSGIPAADLLITVVRKPNGEAHAVLTVHTTEGDYILDNLQNRVLNWQKTDYVYIKRQSSYNAGSWVAIAPQQNQNTVIIASMHKTSDNNDLASTRAITKSR